jgi:hypothetical protein
MCPPAIQGVKPEADNVLYNLAVGMDGNVNLVEFLRAEAIIAMQRARRSVRR